MSKSIMVDLGDLVSEAERELPPIEIPIKPLGEVYKLTNAQKHRIDERLAEYRATVEGASCNDRFWPELAIITAVLNEQEAHNEQEV